MIIIIANLKLLVEPFCRIDFARGHSHSDNADGVADGNGDISEFEFFDPKWTRSADKITFLPATRRKVPKKNGPKEPSLVVALARSFGGVFMMGGLFKFLQDILNFVGPQLLKYVSLDLLLIEKNWAYVIDDDWLHTG